MRHVELTYFTTEYGRAESQTGEASSPTCDVPTGPSEPTLTSFLFNLQRRPLTGERRYVTSSLRQARQH